MPPQDRPNPFSKVTEETSETEQERRQIRARAAAVRKEAKSKKSAQVAGDHETNSTQPSVVAASTSRGAPVQKKRSGLRGVKLAFSHYGVKRVKKRNPAVTILSGKVPRVPLLPGQEDVPLSNSDGELDGSSASDNETDDEALDEGPSESIPEDGASADGEGEPDDLEPGSDGDTVIEELSDEELAAEHGLPVALSPKGPSTLGPLRRQYAVNPAIGLHVKIPHVPLDAQAGLGASANPSTHRFSPATRDSVLRQPSDEHPFGPVPTFNGISEPDEDILVGMPSTNQSNPLSYSQELPSWDWHSNARGANMLDTDMASRSGLSFETNVHLRENASEVFEQWSHVNVPAGFDSNNQPGHKASSFLEQLAFEGFPEQPKSAIPTPAPSFRRPDGHPLAPLPRFRLASTTPSTPHISSPALPIVGSERNTRSPYPFSTPTFARSLSAPSETLGHRLQLRPNGKRPPTCPGTPLGTTPAADFNPSLPSPPGSPGNAGGSVPLPQEQSTHPVGPFDVDGESSLFTGGDEDFSASSYGPSLGLSGPGGSRGIPIVNTDQAPAEPGFLVPESSIPLPMRKKIRLAAPADYAPTLKELERNRDRENAALMRRRKSAPPRPGAREPRHGASMGSFSHTHQGYMFVFRASISADVVMISPWGESEEDMTERAIARAHAATKLKREDVVQGMFLATAMRGISNCRSQFPDAILSIVKDKVTAEDVDVTSLLMADRFMYPTNARLHQDFGDTVLMREVVTEIFFTQGLNLGGLYMQQMLEEDTLETRRKIIMLAASTIHEPQPTSFEYADMSADALRGPPLAAMAFAAIAIEHALKKINHVSTKFDEAHYGETWARYVRLFTSHPRLGVIRAGIFEALKMRYSNTYCRGHRDNSSDSPRAWEWR